MMETLFAIFYVDDAYIASRDPVFLQRAINGLIRTFERVGLETNTKKTQAMRHHLPPTPNRILPTDAHRMHTSCRLGCPHSHLQRMRERYADKLPRTPPCGST